MMSMKFVVVFAMLFAFVASTPLDGLQCLVIFNNAEILKQEIDSATITLTKAGKYFSYDLNQSFFHSKTFSYGSNQLLGIGVAN